MTDTQAFLRSDAVEIDTNASETLATLVRIIRDCGLDPVTQLAGYLMTDDPTYLPDSDHARALADHVGRDKLLETLIELYLEGNGTPAVPSDSCQ